MTDNPLYPRKRAMEAGHTIYAATNACPTCGTHQRYTANGACVCCVTNRRKALASDPALSEALKEANRRRVAAFRAKRKPKQAAGFDDILG